MAPEVGDRTHDNRRSDPRQSTMGPTTVDDRTHDSRRTWGTLTEGRPPSAATVRDQSPASGATRGEIHYYDSSHFEALACLVATGRVSFPFDEPAEAGLHPWDTSFCVQLAFVFARRFSFVVSFPFDKPTRPTEARPPLVVSGSASASESQGRIIDEQSSLTGGRPGKSLSSVSGCVDAIMPRWSS